MWTFGFKAIFAIFYIAGMALKPRIGSRNEEAFY
jgi:hypothetical protein